MTLAYLSRVSHLPLFVPSRPDDPGDDPHCFQQMLKSVVSQDSVRYESLAKSHSRAQRGLIKMERSAPADNKL